MNNLFLDFNTTQLILIGLIFIWTGFVRSGLGFGGAALGLPLMLFIYDQPIFWLPVIGLHLLFFSALTLRTRLHDVDWNYLKKSSLFIVPPALIGVFGLITLPNQWLVVFIYSVTLFYALVWVFNIVIHSNQEWSDRLLLLFGGYVAGMSLTGAPLMVAVFMRNVTFERLRNTLFVLWFVLVGIKMSTFIAFDVKLNWQFSLMLLPAAAIGHLVGLKLHDAILKNNQLFKQVVGGMLIVISGLGLWGVLL
ncbi:MAG TPA: sulfite exporter TauE/SafE family protein [Crenotrichaceae bacterium]|nr:sulfite exporter TauE/SafE family protein [Crenotrichaceae bacterium]